MCSLDNYIDLQLNWFTHQDCIRLYFYDIQFNVNSQESTCCTELQLSNNVLISQTYDTVCSISVYRLIWHLTKDKIVF